MDVAGRFGRRHEPSSGLSESGAKNTQAEMAESDMKALVGLMCDETCRPSFIETLERVLVAFQRLGLHSKLLRREKLSG